jgi:hypothetical protein
MQAYAPLRDPSPLRFDLRRGSRKASISVPFAAAILCSRLKVDPLACTSALHPENSIFQRSSTNIIVSYGSITTNTYPSPPSAIPSEIMQPRRTFVKPSPISQRFGTHLSFLKMPTIAQLFKNKHTDEADFALGAISAFRDRFFEIGRSFQADARCVAPRQGRGLRSDRFRRRAEAAAASRRSRAVPSWTWGACSGSAEAPALPSCMMAADAGISFGTTRLTLRRRMRRPAADRHLTGSRVQAITRRPARDVPESGGGRRRCPALATTQALPLATEPERSGRRGCGFGAGDRATAKAQGQGAPPWPRRHGFAGGVVAAGTFAACFSGFFTWL